MNQLNGKNKNMFQMLLSVAVASLWSASSFAAAVATVNNAPIDSKQIQSEFAQLDELQKERINKDENTRREIVEGAVNAELLVQAAKKEGIEQDSEYKNALEKFKRQYLATRYLQKSVDTQLSKAKVKEFYDKNKSRYDTTEVRAMHILLRDEETARKILTEAKSTKSNEEFATLAKKHSLDPTVQDNGGDLGFFTRDRMVPEFANAAFNSKANEISGPVKSIFGYHVIKLLDVKVGRVPNFEEVEARAKDDLKNHLAQEAILKLRNKAKISVDSGAVKGLKF